MSNIAKMRMRWKKLEVGDLVQPKDESVIWGGTRQVRVSFENRPANKKKKKKHKNNHNNSNCGIIVADNGIQFDVAVQDPDLWDRQKRNHHRVTIEHGAVQLFVPEVNQFPLLKLPLSCLSVVCSHLSLNDGRHFALSCRRASEAFRDECAWRNRCRRELLLLGDNSSDKTQQESWFEFYRRAGTWMIYILTEVPARRLQRLQESAGIVKVLCDPEDTVLAFLSRVIENPKAGISSLDQLDLKPLDPSKLTRIDMYFKPQVVALLPDWKGPNCSFHWAPGQDNSALLKDSGLCQGAVLVKKGIIRWRD